MLARKRLHTGGEVQRGTDHRVFATVAAADQPGKTGPAMYADTNGHTRQPGALELGVVAHQSLAYRQRRMNRIVALPRIRLERPEEYEDAVAEKSTDAPAVLHNAVAYKLEVPIQ